MIHYSPNPTHISHHTPSYSTGSNRVGTEDVSPHPFLVWGFPAGYYEDDDDAIPVGDGVRRRMRVKPDKKARNGAKPKKGAWDNNFF